MEAPCFCPFFFRLRTLATAAADAISVLPAHPRLPSILPLLTWSGALGVVGGARRLRRLRQGVYPCRAAHVLLPLRPRSLQKVPRVPAAAVAACAARSHQRWGAPGLLSPPTTTGRHARPAGTRISSPPLPPLPQARSTPSAPPASTTSHSRASARCVAKWTSFPICGAVFQAPLSRLPLWLDPCLCSTCSLHTRHTEQCRLQAPPPRQQRRQSSTTGGRAPHSSLCAAPQVGALHRRSVVESESAARYR